MKQLMYQIWYDRAAGWKRVVFTPSTVLHCSPLTFASYEHAEADAKRLIARWQ